MSEENPLDGNIQAEPCPAWRFALKRSVTPQRWHIRRLELNRDRARV